MSSIRSRSGGRKISNVLMRYIRSSRKSPAATISGRSRCVAQTTRTSTIIGLVLADAANLAAFQHAQQLGLHRLGQLADFVEEDRAAVGHFEQADAVLVGAGERAFAMAEQLAFDERLGQGAAVDRDERLVGPRALVVNGAGDQFLAGAGFAEDQHGRVRRRDFGDQRANAFHAGRCCRPAAACLRCAPAGA